MSLIFPRASLNSPWYQDEKPHRLLKRLSLLYRVNLCVRIFIVSSEMILFKMKLSIKQISNKNGCFI